MISFYYLLSGSILFIIFTRSLCEPVYDVYDIELFQNKTSESMGYNKYIYPKQQSN